MNWINQVFAITWMSLRTIPQRLGSSLVIVVGIAGVVGVLVALLSMAAGFRSTLGGTGREDRAIVMRAGANAELSSGLSRDAATLVRAAPGILRDAQGQSLATAESVVIADLPKKASNSSANVQLRGVEPTVWNVRPEVRVYEGRAFKQGLRELVVGKGAHDQFANLDIGDTVELQNSDWTVVGLFESGGGVHDSELWGDGEVVQSAYSRNGFQSLTVQLTDADALATFDAALKSDPRLNVDVQSTRTYYATQSRALSTLIDVLGYTIAIIMAIGAVFGALNTMYSAVSTRSREIAVLRAMGFGSGAVVISVMAEALLLALLGGVIGAGVAWLIFNGYTVSTLNGQTFSQVAFAFQVSPELLFSGVQWALIIGFVGGLFPAVRAARVPVTVALRGL